MSRRQGSPGDAAERLRATLGDAKLVVVSNRGPRAPVRGVAVRPASGVVTALEPVIRACGGTWVAQGARSYDLATHVRVRAVALTAAERRGHYHAFSNEGLWRWCHGIGGSPAFRAADWRLYRAVNRRFADAVIDEIAGSRALVFVQDYHLALVPAMLRARRPDVAVATFWHVPWPDPGAAFPWLDEILRGLLASTVLGFQAAGDARRFASTAAGCDVDGSIARIGRYPASIAWPEDVATPRRVLRARLQRQLGVPVAATLAVGVDRFDRIKGLLEKLVAIERLLERRPAWIGRFVLVQVAAPARRIGVDERRYRAQVRRVARRINARFGSRGCQSVMLLEARHDADDVANLLRAADLCLVTSLREGMNLVAKEFVASQGDGKGVLVLGRGAGAAQELKDALLVEPARIDELADAIDRAARMPLAERRARMARLRAVVRGADVHRWAARLFAHALAGRS